MTNNKPIILHISDLHFEDDIHEASEQLKQNIFNNLIEKLSKLPQEWKPTVVCITGDITTKGSRQGFITAKASLLKLSKKLSIPIANFLICPGNHDGKRAPDLNHPNTTEKADKMLGSILDEKLVECFEPFSEFCKDLGIIPYNYGTETSYLVGSREVEGVQFVANNSAWFTMCHSDESNPPLWLGLNVIQHLDQHNQLIPEGTSAAEKICITLLHHGTEAFFHEDDNVQHSPDRTPALKLLWSRAHIALHGHSHEMNSKPSFMENHCQRLGVGGITLSNSIHYNNVNILRLKQHNFEIQQFILDGSIIEPHWKSKYLLPCDFEPSENSLRRIFSDKNIKLLLDNAKAQAGKRYTQELSIQTYAYSIFEAFSRPKSILPKLSNLLKNIYRYKNVFEKMDKCLSGFSISYIETLIEQLRSINKLLREQSYIDYKLFETVSISYNGLIDQVMLIEPILLKEFIEKHGENSDTPSYRQFHAEYMCDFPAKDLDDSRNLLNILTQENNLVDELSYLAGTQFFLFNGSAGIGKTHAIIDFAVNSNNMKQICFVFFGEDFGDEEPWITISSKMGFSRDISSDFFFHSLEKFAISNEQPIILFIDALNETESREKWKHWLPSLMQRLSSIPNIKMCVSCRDTYIDDVIEGETIFQYVHKGFLGNEINAINIFFEFYGIKQPAKPLLQIEFATPLFLHLICQAIVESGKKQLPEGYFGLKDIILLVLENKNKTIARACQYDPEENLVLSALNSLANQMFESNQRHIEYHTSKDIVKRFHEHSINEKSLFYNLIIESLLTKITRKINGSIRYESFCRFTFEKIADFLIADTIFGQEDDYSKFCMIFDEFVNKYDLESKKFYDEFKGLLEMVSLVVSSKFHGKELLELFSNTTEETQYKYVLPIIYSSLPWRNKGSYTTSTKQLIVKGLNNIESYTEAFNTIMKLSFDANSELNIEFISREWESWWPTRRDAYLSYMLHNNYEEKGAVWEIIHWSLYSEIEHLSNNVAKLLATTLTWFCISPDRRIRDKATKCLTRVFIHHPSVINNIFSRFIEIKEEYILERLTLAIYSAYLYRKNDRHFKSIARFIYNYFFKKTKNFPTNALIRDNLRLIYELAYSGESKQISNTYPPFQPNFVLQTVSEDEFEKLNNEEMITKFNMKLGDVHLGSDFERYVLGSKILRSFNLKDIGLSENIINRWMYHSLLEMGYPGRDNECLQYDSYIKSKYGGGRGRKAWAERIGKKYYWILLHRLQGVLADKTNLRNDFNTATSLDRTELQGINLRDIDATDFRYNINKTKFFEYRGSYDFSQTIGIDHDKWIQLDDFPSPEDDIVRLDENNNEWVALMCYLRQEGRMNLNQDEEFPYRDICNYTNSAFVSREDSQNYANNINKENALFSPSDFTPYNYTVFLAEYPYSSTAMKDIDLNSGYLDFTNSDYEYRYTNLELLRGSEWGLDFSSDDLTENLQVPAPELILYKDLEWDGGYSWHDSSGEIQIISINEKHYDALFIKRQYLTDYLNSTDQVLLHFSFLEKRVFYDNTFSKYNEIHESRQIFSLDGNSFSKLIKFNEIN